MGGGAWPFLVGGVICLVNSDHERVLLNRFYLLIGLISLLIGTGDYKSHEIDQFLFYNTSIWSCMGIGSIMVMNTKSSFNLLNLSFAGPMLVR